MVVDFSVSSWADQSSFLILLTCERTGVAYTLYKFQGNLVDFLYLFTVIGCADRPLLRKRRLLT